MEKGGIVVREVNSEILIFLDNNRSTRLDALREATKILQREVIREERQEQKRDYQEQHNDGFDWDF